MEETRFRLEIAALRLLALDSLEQRLEVALTKATGALALNDLKEDGRTFLHVAREDLQQIAIVVAVHQNAELRQFLDWLVDFADARLQLVIVAWHALDELDTLVAQMTY